MKRFAVIFVTITVFLFTLCSGVFAAEIKVGAGQAPTENILKPIKEPFEKATGIKLSITPSGPKVALIDLEKGVYDVALGGLSFEDWLNYVKKEGGEVKDASSLQHVPIGKDRIVIMIHKDNPVSKLSKEQLKGIFTGKIANWKDVGGKDMPIIVVWTKLLGGNFHFVKMILDGEPQTKDVLEATTSADAKMNVVSNPEAIALGPIAIIDSSVKSPETPEVARVITLVTKGKPSPDVQKLVDFIKGDGQKYVKQ